jgi:hypothetical protein
MRILSMTVLTAAILGVVQGTAAASESPWPEDTTVPAAEGAAAAELLGAEQHCDEFRHVQTYRNWGPARHFDQMVTVDYRAARCAAPAGTAVDLAMDGTATIHEGDSASGRVLGTRPFTVLGTWEQPTNPMGWPPDWWQCGVPFAEYRWEIIGVYSFEVSAADGSWTLVVDVADTPAGDVHWSFDACS